MNYKDSNLNLKFSHLLWFNVLCAKKYIPLHKHKNLYTMKLTSMQNRITVRLDNDTNQSLDIMHQVTKTDKAKLVRMIMKDWFDKNEELINKYYVETKAE